MIDPKSIENLKNIIDIESVIGSFLELKRSGSGFVARCPFHEERTASFHISPQKGLYHCFGCKAGGDAIKFIMEYEHLGYKEAVEKIAAMHNFTLHYTSDKNSQERDVKPVLDILNLHYKTQLFTNSVATAYLKDRGLDDSDIEKWELGWASSSQNTLNLLNNEQIPPKDAIYSGAVKQNDGGLYASFIERITFPIKNHLGRVVGFGGRTISDHPAKYVNSPQSAVFDKSRLLYGYHLAKNEIFKERKIVICEGYMDCIMLHKAGIRSAVAVLGTALTAHHLPLIKRGEPKVILCFDSDSAGISAAIKSAHLLAINGVDGEVVLLSGGKDPAELVASGKANLVREMINSGTELGEFYIKELVKNSGANSPAAKAKVLKEIASFTYQLAPIAAASYEPLVAGLLNADMATIRLARVPHNKISNKQPQSGDGDSRIAPRKDLAEMTILKNMLQNPHFLAIARNEAFSELFTHHAQAYAAVIGSQNASNPHIRELMMDDSLQIFSSDEAFCRALDALKLTFASAQLRRLAGSGEDSFVQINRLQKLITALKDRLK